MTNLTTLKKEIEALKKQNKHNNNYKFLSAYNSYCNGEISIDEAISIVEKEGLNAPSLVRGEYFILKTIKKYEEVS